MGCKLYLCAPREEKIAGEARMRTTMTSESWYSEKMDNVRQIHVKLLKFGSFIWLLNLTGSKPLLHIRIRPSHQNARQWPD